MNNHSVEMPLQILILFIPILHLIIKASHFAELKKIIRNEADQYYQYTNFPN